MKRDMELVRKILLRIEEDNTFHLRSSAIEIDGRSADQTGYHLKIMVEGGLIDAIDSSALLDRVPQFFIKGITWYGHEFLDSIRDEGVWSHTKNALKPVGSASFEVVKAIAVACISSKLGLS